MAQLQYIGARYVPKYYQNSLDPTSSEWEPGKVYEALIVVTYQDDSYISKIPVPSNIGDPASYPAYWAKSSFNAAAVAALQEQVNENTEDITTLKEDVKKKKPVFYTPASYPDFTDGIDLITNMNKLQGGCILPDGKIVQYVTNSGETVGYLMLIGDDGILIQNSNADYGHGNDLMWSVNTNRLYMTGANADTIEVFALSGSSFGHETSISLTDMFVQGMVEIGDSVYTYDQTTGNIYKTDTDFAVFELIKENVIPVGADYLHQGLASDDEYLYWLGMDTSASRTCVYVFDLDGNYIDGWSYGHGWGEGEWLDFDDKHAYMGFMDRDIPLYIIRKDMYRNDKYSYSPAQDLSNGKMTPTYIHLDSTSAGGFKTGLDSTSPFNRSELICKLTHGMSGICIRQAATNKKLRLYDISCEIRGDATLDELYLTRCILLLHTDALKCTTAATVLRSIIDGDIESDISNCNRTIICGSITGSLTGNNNIVTGTITGTNNITPAP